MRVTCPFCSALCPDVELKIQEQKVIEVLKACSRGEREFLRAGSENPAVRGKGTNYSDALQEARNLLQGSQKPLFCNLRGSSSETLKALFHLARARGGILTCGLEGGLFSGTRAGQNVGLSSCTLGELGEDFLLVLWGWEFTPYEKHFFKEVLQKKFREIMVIGSGCPFSAGEFLPVEPTDQLQVLTGLQALLLGKEKQQKRLQPLIQAIMGYEKGIFFLGRELKDCMEVQKLHSLVQDLNCWGRFHILPVPSPDMEQGAENTLTALTGFPFAIYLHRGEVFFNPGEYSGKKAIMNGDVDLVLACGLEEIPAILRQAMGEIPLINLGGDQDLGDIFLPAARPGLEESGTLYRLDGVSFYLEKIITSSMPGRGSLLRALQEG